MRPTARSGPKIPIEIKESKFVFPLELNTTVRLIYT